ncbi:MAG: ComF family protein [Candidatus Omnitrophica bacterium]|nr:ComF family protein [Candidatus Omnitrophota bacterium]MDD5771402.1 ComF family protein [Candidatus Omnitrophota bacterium]
MLRGFFRGIRDLIYPNFCPGCKNKISPAGKQDLICGDCWEKIERNLPPFCVYCGRRLEKRGAAVNICARCLRNEFHFDRAFSPCSYTGIIKKLIHEFKYSGRDYLGEPLGRLMNDFIRDYRLPIEYMDFIVPVPLHKSRLREREFNQAQLLSEEIAGEFDKEVLTGILVRNRQTRTQTELSPEERRRNVKSSFSVRDKKAVKGANILLVDDVLTTGATSSEAARVLKDSGAGIIFVMTLAN